MVCTDAKAHTQHDSKRMPGLETANGKAEHGIGSRRPQTQTSLLTSVGQGVGEGAPPFSARGNVTKPCGLVRWYPGLGHPSSW